MANSYRVAQTSQRPWGDWSVIAVGAAYAVKQITVHPGGSLSLQRHRWRDEHWVVVQGVADIEVDAQARSLAANESVFIRAGQVHRIANRGASDLVLIEVQYGGRLEEDDIERLRDEYGRG